MKTSKCKITIPATIRAYGYYNNNLKVNLEVHINGDFFMLRCKKSPFKEILNYYCYRYLYVQFISFTCCMMLSKIEVIKIEVV